MASRILVAVDLGDASLDALSVACARARKTGAELAVCHVLPHLDATHALMAPNDDAVMAHLAELERRVRLAIEQRLGAIADAPKATVFVERGAEYAEVVRRAEVWSATLVVLGSHGRSGLSRLLLGSVAEKIVRHAHCPVLVVRKSPRSDCVLVATDLSDPSLPAVAAGAEEARRLGVRLVVAHALDLSSSAFGAALGGPFGASPVLPPAELQKDVHDALTATLRQALARYNAEGEVRVLDGSPAAAIVECAHDLGAGLLVVGTHGRTGLARVALGSVAERIVRSAECSVLAVRQVSR